MRPELGDDSTWARMALPSCSDTDGVERVVSVAVALAATVGTATPIAGLLLGAEAVWGGPGSLHVEAVVVAAVTVIWAAMALVAGPALLLVETAASACCTDGLVEAVPLSAFAVAAVAAGPVISVAFAGSMVRPFAVALAVGGAAAGWAFAAVAEVVVGTAAAGILVGIVVTDGFVTIGAVGAGVPCGVEFGGTAVPAVVAFSAASWGLSTVPGGEAGTVEGIEFTDFAVEAAPAVTGCAALVALVLPGAGLSVGAVVLLVAVA